MTARRKPPKLAAWHASERWRAAAKAGSEKAERLRQMELKCGAIKRTDGTPCRNVALENGRCRYHGGKTPKGRN